jgi:putative hydrolase of the HAD superfamily
MSSRVQDLVRAVLVDLGDTLVHLDRPWVDVFLTNLEALHKYFTSLGIKIDVKKFNDRFVSLFNDASYRADLLKVEVPMEEIISKSLRKSGLQVLGVDLPTNATIEFYRPEVESWQLYADSIETLTKLSKNGYVLGLISNAKSDWAVREILRRRGLDVFFNTIVSSAALKIRKPRFEIFRRALTDLDVKPSDAVFIGDSIQADVGGAKSMGMYAIHVLRKPVDPTSLSRPDATVTNLSETLEIIAKWNNGSKGNR